MQTIDYNKTLQEAATRATKYLGPNITIEPSPDDIGFAVRVAGSESWVEILPAEGGNPAFISITQPNLTPHEAREFAALLLAAATYAESLNKE